MKKDILLFISVSLLFVLVACTGEEKTKPQYTVEEAVNDGHIVVQHLSQNFDEVRLDGKLETKQLKKIFEFKKMAEQGKKAEVKITIFNKNGTYVTSKLNFSGEKYVFENNFTGYKSPEGTFTCDYFTLRHGTAGLKTCKNKDGKQLNRVTVLLGEIDKFKELEREVLP